MQRLFPIILSSPLFIIFYPLLPYLPHCAILPLPNPISSLLSLFLLDWLLSPRDAMDAAAKYILRTSPPSAPGVHPLPLGPDSGPVFVLVPSSTLASSASSVANASNAERRSGVESASTADDDLMRYSTLVSYTEHGNDVQCVYCAVRPRLLQLAIQS